MHAAIIDPSPASRAILANLLLDYGLRVHEAATAGAALSILRAHPEIRVILIDWNIAPDGNEAGAYELVKQIRSDPRLAGRRIIMITAEAGVEDVAAALEAGIDDYLTRPFRAASVREKLDLLGVMAA